MRSALIPMVYFGISSAISLFALNASQRYRIYFGPFLLLFALLSFHHLDDLPSWLGLRGLWGLLITIYIIHITAVLYIDKMILVPVGKHNEESGIATLNFDPRSASWNFRAAYKVWNNPRRLPSSLTNNDSTVSPGDIKWPTCKTNVKSLTLTSFIILRTLRLCAYTLIYHLVATYIFLGSFRPIAINDFSLHRESFFSRLIFAPTASRQSLRR